MALPDYSKKSPSGAAERRNFLRKALLAGGAGAIGSLAMAGFDRSALATPHPAQTAYGGLWQETSDYDVLVFVDSSGNYYTKDGDTGQTTQHTDTTTGGIQEAINSLKAGGTIYIKAGIYNISNPLVLPWGVSFYFIGDGLPSFQQPQAPGTSYKTPTDGTQIRATAAGFNSAGTNIGIFTRAAGGANRQGTIGFDRLAIMPAWGTTSLGTNVYCLYENVPGQFGSMFYLLGDVLFAPWGWTEAGTPIPASTQSLNDIYLNLGGSATQIKGYAVKTYGMRESNTLAVCDSIHFAQLLYHACSTGLVCQASDGIIVDELIGFDCGSYYLAISVAGGQGGILNRIGKIFVEQDTNMGAYVVHLSDSHVVLKCDEVFVWGSGNFNPINAVTNADNTQLLYPCHFWTSSTGTQQLRAYPLATEAGDKAFGDTVPAPFGASTIGTRGSSPNPVSGTAYRANTFLDVTIGMGTGQTITTKDASGMIVDDAVDSLTHRVLYPNWTIAVTYTQVGTVTVVQAILGSFGAFGGTTGVPQAGVNYVALRRCYITAIGGNGTMTTLDGSNNTGGGTMDSSIAVPIYRYCIEAAQIVSFPSVPSTVKVIQQ